MGFVNYFISGITAGGYISYLENCLEGIEKTYFVTGEADYAPLSAHLLKHWEAQEYNLEYAHNPFMNFPYEAIINRSLSTAVVFNLNPQSPLLFSKQNAQTLDLNRYKNPDEYKKRQDTLRQLYQNRQSCNESAYLYFARALKVHDEWEKIYIANMDFGKLDKLTASLCQNLIGENRADKQAAIKHRFLGAATPEGAKDFVLDITKNAERRFFIKGRPGSGKSTMLKKIGKYASDRGFKTEIYHCGFDSNSLDMINVPELSVCIFDSTAPHEHFPQRQGDEIVDVYKEAITPGTDEKYSAELDEISSRYRACINIATSYLKTMQNIDKEISKIYNKFISVDIASVFAMN